VVFVFRNLVTIAHDEQFTASLIALI